MKFLIAAVAAFLSLPAQAQDAQLVAHLNEKISYILANRVYKTWTPQAFANSKTVAKMPSIAGIAVQIDESIENDTLIIRNKEAFKQHPGGAREETTPPNQPMITEKWIGN